MLILSILECFQENKSLSQYSVSKHSNVSTTVECQEDYCQSNDKCSAFVYNINTKECFLKKPPKRFLGIVQLEDKEWSIFGPKHCPCLVHLRIIVIESRFDL